MSTTGGSKKMRVWVAVVVLMLLLVCGSSGARNLHRRTVLYAGWRQIKPRHISPENFYFPRTENYYYKMKPEAVIEIVMDPHDDDDDDDEFGHRIVEHSSITTSIQNESEYKSSCAKEPGCRWECEPRQDELPPDCDCVCFYTDAKWDSMP